MNEDETAFAQFMLENFTEVWKNKEESPYTSGAIFMARAAWKAGRAFEQSKKLMESL